MTKFETFVDIITPIGSLAFISIGICFIVKQYLLEGNFSMQNPLGYLFILFGLNIILLKIMVDQEEEISKLKKMIGDGKKWIQKE